jgi:hypothetical protein
MWLDNEKALAAPYSKEAARRQKLAEEPSSLIRRAMTLPEQIIRCARGSPAPHHFADLYERPWAQL